MGNLPLGMFSPSAPLLRKTRSVLFRGLALHIHSAGCWLVPLVLCDFLLARAAAHTCVAERCRLAWLSEIYMHLTPSRKRRVRLSRTYFMLFTMLVERARRGFLQNAALGRALCALNRRQWNKEKVSQIASLSPRQRLLVLTQALNDFSAVLKWLQQLHFQMSFVNWILPPLILDGSRLNFLCFDDPRELVSSCAARVQTKCPLTRCSTRTKKSVHAFWLLGINQNINAAATST